MLCDTECQTDFIVAMDTAKADLLPTTPSVITNNQLQNQDQYQLQGTIHQLQTQDQYQL